MENMYSHVSGGGSGPEAFAAIAGGHRVDNWSFAPVGSGRKWVMPGAEPELDTYFRQLLINEMVGHRALSVDRRLAWCRDVCNRTDAACTDPKQGGLEKKSMGVIPRKVDDLYSWLLDLIIRSFDDVFRIEPTPRPNLSEEVRDAVRNQMVGTLREYVTERAAAVVQQITGEYRQLGVSITPDQAVGLAEERGVELMPDEDVLRDMAGRMHATAKTYEERLAHEGTQRLTEVVKDILTSTHSLDQMVALLHDFCTLPYAVMEGGGMTRVKTRVWKKRKAVYVDKWLPGLRRVSPWDFFWTADSTDCHNGTAIAERMAMRRFDLKSLKSRSFIFSDRVDAVLNVYEGQARNWVAPREQVYEAQATQWSSFPHETIDVFKMFVRITGHKLLPYKVQVTKGGLSKIDPEQEYHCEVWMTGNTMIGLRVHAGDYVRQYNHVAYEPVPSDFPGNSLPENLAVIHSASRQTFRLMVRNMAKSTNPALILDREMWRGSLDDDEDILPDTQYEVSRPIGYNGNAVQMLEFPNYTGQTISFQEYLDLRADIESGIPKYALGQAQGLPSALRSVAALKLMIDSALKTMTSRVFRIGRVVIAPGIRELVRFIVDSKEYPDVDVDAEVVVQGTEGAIRKVMVLDNFQGLLQYLAPFAAAGLVKPEVLQSIIDDYLVAAGVGNTDIRAAGDEFRRIVGAGAVPQQGAVGEHQQPPAPAQPG